MSNSSLRRLVITAVLAGSSRSEAARTFGVSQGWISRLMKRYAAEGEAAFEPRSRAPRTSPTATAATTIDVVLETAQEALRGRPGRPARTPSTGISNTTTRSRWPRPQSTGSWFAPGR
jgi:transposase